MSFFAILQIFFVLNKKYNHISLLHVSHHALMPLGLWYGVRTEPGTVPLTPRTSLSLWYSSVPARYVGAFIPVCPGGRPLPVRLCWYAHTCVSLVIYYSQPSVWRSTYLSVLVVSHSQAGVWRPTHLSSLVIRVQEGQGDDRTGWTEVVAMSGGGTINKIEIRP